MKEKIIEQLKKEYASYGLGDRVFEGAAQFIEPSIEEESDITDAVKSLSGFLKSFQSDADSIRTAKTVAEKKAAELEEQIKALKDVKPNESPKTDPPKNDYEARFAMMEKMFEEKLSATQTELAQYKSAAEQAKRNAFINSKAVELGIPQSFIDRGLGVSNEADEDAIISHLSGFAEDLAKERETTIGRFQVPRKKELSIEDGQEILKRLKV